MANCSTNSVVPHASKSEPNGVSSNSESGYNSMHAEYQVPSIRMYASGGPYNAFYSGGNAVNYPEDRYAAGYQRNVPTIDLTRFSFGGQNQFPPFGRHAQRYDDSNYRHYRRLPAYGGKQWNGNAIVEQPSITSSKTGNRGRTTYSDEQIAELENVFNNNPYPTAQMRQHLAFKIDVPEGKVKIWFQNRRARAKKFKISCAASGWRLQLNNDSRSCEEQGNQNNNNTNNDSTTKCELLSTSTFSMKTFLPLPTKPVAESQQHQWQNSSKMQQSKGPSSLTNSRAAQSFFPGRSAAAGISSNSVTSSGIDGAGKTHDWIWPSAHVPSQFPTVPRTSLRIPGEYQYGKERALESWRNNISTTASANNVPDLVTQTSRVGLNEIALSATERDESERGKGENSSTNITTAFQESSLQDTMTERNDAMPSSESKTPGPLSICESPPDVICSGSQGQRQENPSAMSFSELMKSPPPIRRLVFPFQTLPDSKTNSPETSLQGFMSYPPILNPNPTSYCGPNQSSVGNQVNLFSAKMSCRTRDQSYHTNNFSKGLAPHLSNFAKRVYPCEEEGLAYFGSSSWYCDPAKPAHGGMGSYQSVSKYIRHNSSLAQPVNEEVADTNDDVQNRDVRRMDVAKPGVAVDNAYQPYWSSVSVVPTVSKNEAANTGDSTAGRDDTDAERLVNFSNDVLPQDDAAATWTNQLITGFNPPVSASIVS